MATFLNPELIKKYDRQVPRYTSYPTVPFWTEDVKNEEWISVFTENFKKKNNAEGISLYIHLPFCESLCTYCGCNKKITTNHSVEDVYLSAIEKEWNIYRSYMNEKPVIRELHLGGGTPTFFSPENLAKLLDIIFRDSIIHPEKEFSIEGHPNNTTAGHLEMLYEKGFRRISYGVQDNDKEVQRVINRIQPFENVKRATELARKTGFTSVNFDLIYGLPLQTQASIERTINEVITLRPDRIAFYSYAHVPWTSRAQRLFDESHLPAPEEKINLYMTGKKMLLQNGYTDIGMDHFAVKGDALEIAFTGKTLHRNFMGYTTQHSGLLLGLGVSSISDTGNAFAQNKKTLHEYYTDINSGKLSIHRGYILNEVDQSFRKYILDISCRGETFFHTDDIELLEEYTFPKLKELEADGLVVYDKHSVKLTEQGHYFLRNICSAFDLHLCNSRSTEKLYSRAI